MTRFCKSLLGLSALAIPLFAGGLVLQVGDPSSNQEALLKHAVMVVRMTACRSPAQTKITATAEGSLHGARQHIPLQLIQLSTPGTLALAQQWPGEGSWEIEFVATNPDYKDYASSLVVPVRGGRPVLDEAKQFYRTPPTEAELSASLK